MRQNSVVDMENEFFGNWGQHEFRENIKQQSKHDILTKVLPVLELLQVTDTKYSFEWEKQTSINWKLYYR